MAGKPQASIGFAAPLSGGQAMAGVPMCRCAELAVAQANERGDLPFHLVLDAQNDHADPATAVAIARRFAEDPSVIGVVGHKNSGPSGAAAPIYATAGLAQVSPSSTNSRLSRQGYRTFFRLCAHDPIQGAAAARYAIRVLGAKRLAVIHDRTDYGQPLAEIVRTTTGDEGGTVVLFEGITEGDTNFSDVVDRIRRVSPELIYFALTEVEGAILARQLRDAGSNAIFFGAQGGRDTKFLRLAGPAAAGSYHTYAGVDPETTPSARAFRQEFEARYGPVPSFGPEVYDSASLLVAALVRVGSADRAGVLRELSRIEDFAGASGVVNFEPNGDRRDAQVSIWHEEDGALQLLGMSGALGL